jgi:hypothetical protein
LLKYLAAARLSTLLSSFFLHTYLVEIRRDQDDGNLSELPALHSAVVGWYESPSGASLAQFLIYSVF